ncbi:MAG: DUF2079 domain-containing protein [Candidatus Omnitrophota bacterium]
MRSIDKFCEIYANKLICVFIFIYVLLFCFLCFLKFHSFEYYDWDFASDIITLWNSTHGNFLYYPFLEENIFGAHLYIIILLIIPIYALFENPLTLLFLQSLFLGLGAYPLYLLARSKLNKTLALVISLAYLLYPSLGFMNLFETHFEIYVIFFLFFAIYYFEMRSFGKFALFIILAISCKENVSFVVFMFGIYALFKRMPWRWVIFPCVLGAGWFFLAVKVIIPHFARDADLYQGGFMFSNYYQHLGGSIFEIAKTVLFSPSYTARFIFTPAKVLYMCDLFMPTGFIGLINPLILIITVPVFLQNMLSSQLLHTRIHYHYVSSIVPFIFSSVVFGFKKIVDDELLREYSNKLILFFLIFVIFSGIYLEAPQIYFFQHLNAYKIDYLAKEKNRLVEMIPPGASVMSTFKFLPKLANRFDLYSLHLVTTGFRMYTNVRYQPPPNLEYAIVDFADPLLHGSFFPEDAPRNMRNFLKDGDWRVFDGFDENILFKKSYPGGSRLYEESDAPEIENIINANIGNNIIFIGYDVLRNNTSCDGMLPVIFYWRPGAKPSRSVGFIMEFLDKDNNIKFAKDYTLGYTIYPPTELPKEKTTGINRFILIPPGIKSGLYDIRIRFYDKESAKTLSVLSGQANGADSIILKDILIKV